MRWLECRLWSCGPRIAEDAEHLMRTRFTRLGKGGQFRPWWIVKRGGGVVAVNHDLFWWGRRRRRRRRGGRRRKKRRTMMHHPSFFFRGAFTIAPFLQRTGHWTPLPRGGPLQSHHPPPTLTGRRRYHSRPSASVGRGCLQYEERICQHYAVGEIEHLPHTFLRCGRIQQAHQTGRRRVYEVDHLAL